MLNFKERHLAASCAVVLFAAAFAPVGSIADEAAVKARIERAKIELAKIKQGKKLSILDATKPEVVLPPLLILVDEDLKEFGIDKEALAADIKANPAKYRNAAPEHWRKRFLLLAPEQEKLLGDEFDRELQAKGNVCKDKKQMRRINTIVDRIVAQIPGQNRKNFKLHLYRDDSINAFCLPNGSIYVNSGLLEQIKSDDVLAFILGHEIAHYVARHGNESSTKCIMTMAGNTVAANEVYKYWSQGKVKRGALLAIGYFGASKLAFMLPFSREMEKEADTLGIRYMARAGYDPAGAIEFFRMLGDGSNSGWGSFLSTHPTGKKRMEHMQKEYLKLKNGTKSLGDIAADFTHDDKKREEAKEKTKKGFGFLKGKTKEVLEGK